MITILIKSISLDTNDKPPLLTMRAVWNAELAPSPRGAEAVSWCMSPGQAELGSSQSSSGLLLLVRFGLFFYPPYPYSEEQSTTVSPDTDVPRVDVLSPGIQASLLGLPFSSSSFLTVFLGSCLICFPWGHHQATLLGAAWAILLKCKPVTSHFCLKNFHCSLLITPIIIALIYWVFTTFQALS